MATDLIPATIAAAAGPPGSGGPPIGVEHFASNFLRRHTLRLLDGLPLAIGRPVLVAAGRTSSTSWAPCC